MPDNRAKILAKSNYYMLHNLSSNQHANFFEFDNKYLTTLFS